MQENNHIEFKRELSDSLEKEVIAFLNYKDGGIIYVGIDKTGAIVGVINPDDTQLKIKDRIKNNISPSTMGLFDVVTEMQEGKYVIKVIVASGSEKPYYLSKMGMSTRGCYIRIGSAAEPMSERMIEDLFARRTRNSIGTIRSRYQDLTFEQLRIYYSEAKLDLNYQFAKNLELLTEDGKYNYAAYMLSDMNGVSIKVAKYSGLNRVDLIENEEYGMCCLIKATKSVLEKLKVENKTFAKITDTLRKERKLLDPTALREAIINAIIHRLC
ncbi:MAG TPA: ATP-binding protein [Aquella sp.]|nr:ATP-binding protein [Aquella sp.]